MHIVSQLRLSTFDGGKTFNAEVRIGDQFFAVTETAVRSLLAEHRRLGGVVTKFAPRSVTIKNATRAATFGKKVGDIVTVWDYASRTMAFDATVGDGVVDGPSNIELVSFAINGDGIDLGTVKEVEEVKASPATVVASAPADDDIA